MQYRYQYTRFCCYQHYSATMETGPSLILEFFDGFISHSLNKKGIMICVACNLLGVVFGYSIGKESLSV